MEQQTTQKMTYESRMALVANHFVKRASSLYQAHVRLRDNEAGGIYLQEMAEAINSRLPSEIPNDDVYIEALRDIWKLCIEKHKSSYWFDLATVIAASNKVASKYYRIYGKQKAKVFQGQADESDTRKKNEGWTLAGARRELEKTDAMIASGEIGRGMGEVLRRIPLKAIERLGGNADIAPPPMQATPADHLPADAPKPAIAKPIMEMSESELDMRLLKAGMTAPKFDNQPDDFEDALPENMQGGMPAFDSL